jgi:hypothetical protein
MRIAATVCSPPFRPVRRRAGEGLEGAAWAAVRSAEAGQWQGLTEQAWSERIRARALRALAVGPIECAKRVGSYVYLDPPATDVERVLASRTGE